jgi:predicted dehydrogenase
VKRRTSRRNFMKNTALTGVGVWLVGDYRRTQAQAANDKIRVASIGVKGKGDSDSKDAGKLGELVALCDIDDNKLQQQAAEFKMAAKYHDYRKMLEEMGDKIDAVTVSTPDHTHAPAALMAMRMKKHAFVQKPLTHTVHEARLMRETAAKMGVATQMGNQGTANSALRSAAVAVQSGLIGKVTEAHVWTNRPIWAQGGSAPKDMPECPKNIHWDLWLGPAKERAYHPAYLPFAWRGWWDFGTGALGDMACHTANMPFMALKLGYPTSIVAETPEINADSYPKSSKITFEFPAREGLPPVKFVWYDGGQKPGADVLMKVEGQKVGGSGAILIGDKGTIFAGKDDYCGSYVMLPEKEFADVKQPEPAAKSPGHMQEWFDAMKGGPKAWSNFDYAAYLTEIILLGNVAMRVGKKIDWDGPNMKSTNCPEAAQYVKKEYRKGFEVEV